MGIRFSVHSNASTMDREEVCAVMHFTNKLLIDYQSYESLLDDLIRVIKYRAFLPTHIYSPPRGGWPIAVHLSHHLKIPIIQASTTWDWQLNHPEANSILFVDDIVDSGLTLERFIADIKRKRSHGWWIHQCSCSLVVKPRARIKPDISVMSVADETWVVFPWEPIEEAVADQKDYTQRREKQ